MLTLMLSRYFENVWGWVGDHDIDFNSQGLDGQIDIFVGRGFLIIGDGGGLVFRGTASEHSVLYQYNIVNAKNVYLSIIQTESPCEFFWLWTKAQSLT